MIQSLNDAKEHGANDGYKSSNFYFDRAMDQRAGLRVGGHLPAGGNRRRLVHPRIPEPSGCSGRDCERTRTGYGKCSRRRPNSDSGSDAENGRHAGWTLIEKLKADPANAGLLEKHREIYYDAQQFPTAIDYYQRALKVQPSNTGVRTDMATAYWYTGDAIPPSQNS